MSSASKTSAAGGSCGVRNYLQRTDVAVRQSSPPSSPSTSSPSQPATGAQAVHSAAAAPSGANDVPDEYRTPYPIAWYGAGGWRKEIENKGGPQHVGVRLTNAQNANNASSSSRKGLYKALRKPLQLAHNDLLLLATVAIAAVTIACLSVELLPASAVTFLVSGGILFRPLILLFNVSPSFRQSVIRSEGLVRFWNRVMNKAPGWAVVHMLAGILTVWAVAALHLNRTRAYLTVLLVSLWSVRAVDAANRRWKMVPKLNALLVRVRTWLRSLNPSLAAGFDVIFPPHKLAVALKTGLCLLVSVVAPWLLLCAGGKWFPKFTRWLTDDLSARLIVTLLLASVCASLVFSLATTWTSLTPFTQASSSGFPSGHQQQSPSPSCTESMTQAFAFVLAAFLVMQRVYPEFCGMNAKAVLDAHFRDVAMYGGRPA